jgi:hypothetical protein
VFRQVQGRNHQFNDDLTIVAEDIVVLESRLKR